MVLEGGADTHVRSFGEESHQEGRPRPRSSADWTDWTCVVPQQPGQVAPTALSPQPVLGFRAPDQPFLISLSACCPSGSGGLSLPALPCPVLQGPHVGACPGELAFRSPAQQFPGEAPKGLVAPSVSVLGSDFYWTAQDVLSRFLVAAVCASHTACLPCQSLAVPPPALVSLAEPSCPRNRGAKGCIEVRGPRGHLGSWGPLIPPPKDSKLEWKIHQDSILGGLLKPMGSPRERHCTDI